MAFYRDVSDEKRKLELSGWTSFGITSHTKDRIKQEFKSAMENLDAETELEIRRLMIDFLLCEMGDILPKISHPRKNIFQKFTSLFKTQKLNK
jgi:hypothetical protein